VDQEVADLALVDLEEVVLVVGEITVEVQEDSVVVQDLVVDQEVARHTNIRHSMLKLKPHSGFHDLFDSDMSKSTNMVVYTLIGKQ
jgi:hypothetical protein